MKRVVIGLMCASLVLSGCATNRSLEAEEKSALSSEVAFSVSNPQFRVVLDKQSHIVSICTMSQQCEGVNDVNNDIIGISSNGIGLVGYRGAVTTCGNGYILPDPDTDKNRNYTEIGGSHYTKIGDNNDERACSSQFYKVSNSFLYQRIVYGVLSLGGLAAMAGTASEKSFDPESLREAAYNFHLRNLQTLLFSPESKINSRGAISVIFIDTDHIEEIYKKIIDNPIGTDSIVLIDENTKIPLYVLSVGGYQDKTLPIAVNSEISAMVSALAGRSATSTEATGLDVQKMIPPEISVPTLPPVPKLSKDEYETKANFSNRVKAAVTEREETIRSLQQQYLRDVYNRNQYIAALGVSWQAYLDGKATDQNEMVIKLKKNQTQLAKLFYAMNLGKFTASNFSYDAENQSYISPPLQSVTDLSKRCWRTLQYRRQSRSKNRGIMRSHRNSYSRMTR